MSDAPTTEFALAYLAELQPGLQAVSILDQEGNLLAGQDGPATISVGDGHVIRAASDGLLDRLAALDMETVLADLAGRREAQ